MPSKFTVLWLAMALCLTPLVAHAGKVQVHTLDNGLTVVLKEEHKAPVVSFQVWYQVGSMDEVTGATGLSHLLEHMMFKGTENHGKGEYSRLVARYGGDENAFTYRDYTAYFMNWSPQHLPLSVKLESDRMTGLLLDPDEFNLEREVVREERRMRVDDNPIFATIEQMYAAAFTAHPYRSPIIGWMTDLEQVTRDQAMTHYRRYYVPNNATVVVVGDFDADATLALIKKSFGPIPRAAHVPRVAVVEPQQYGERRVTLHRQAQLPFLFLGYPTPNWESDDAYALVVLSRILFEGERSRLYQRLVYNDRLAVDGGGAYEPLSADPGLFYFYAVMAPDKSSADAEAALYEEIERLQTEPPEKRELARAKNQVEADHIMGQDSVFYQAMMLGQAETVGAGSGYITSFPDRIRKVSGKDVMRVAKKYLTPRTRTVAVLVPEAPHASLEGEK